MKMKMIINEKWLPLSLLSNLNFLLFSLYQCFFQLHYCVHQKCFAISAVGMQQIFNHRQKGGNIDNVFGVFHQIGHPIFDKIVTIQIVFLRSVANIQINRTRGIVLVAKLFGNFFIHFVVNHRFVYVVVLHNLNVINHTSNVVVKIFLQMHQLRANQMNRFVFANVQQMLDNHVFGQLIEPKFNEFVLQSFFNAIDVIANQAKTHIGRENLQQIAQGLLGIFGHIVDFVQNNKFHSCAKHGIGGDKTMNLVSYGVNASFVRCI